MIRVDEVTKVYRGVSVVDRVTLDLGPGITALVGANGAGKSTLLSIIGRLVEADRGTVTVDGLDTVRAPGDALARRVAILRQQNTYAVRLTVRELVEFGRHPHSAGRLTPEDHTAVDAALDALDLGAVASRRLDQLSGGQRQRASIAMVLAQDTPHLLLDEPLNSLDLRYQRRLLHELRALAERDRTVVVVLHDINVAAHHADRIVALRDGAVVADGTARDVIDPATLADVYDCAVEVRTIDGAPVALPWR